MPPEDHHRCQSLLIWNETAGEWGNSLQECTAIRHCWNPPLHPQSTCKETNNVPVSTQSTALHAAFHVSELSQATHTETDNKSQYVHGKRCCDLFVYKYSCC